VRLFRGSGRIAPVLALAGCVQIAGLGEVRYDPPLDDAGPIPVTTNEPEGGWDGAEAETAPPPATGPTTPPNAGTVDPSAPCNEQQAYVFCEDFDTEAAPDSDWDYQSVGGTGALSFSSTAYTSPMRSLHATSTMGGDASVSQASLGKAFGSFSTQLRLAFDFWINTGTFDGLPVLGIAQIHGTPATGASQVSINVEYTPTVGFQVEAYLSGMSSPPTSVPIPYPALGSWTRVVLSYSSAGILVYENGLQVASNPAATVGGLTSVSFQIGDVYAIPPATQNVDIQFDNVVLSGG
jgi:hypothetical protein